MLMIIRTVARLNKTLVSVVIVIIMFCTAQSTSQYLQSSGICSGVCVCLKDQENIIVCNKGDKLVAIPQNIPKIYLRLIIQQSLFDNRVIQLQNLTGLEHLNYLKIIYCKLEYIEPQAFRNMRNLTYLDLSHNRLKLIEPYTFEGLRLKNLHLTENPGLIIKEKSFAGLKVQEINLRSNGITELSSVMFRNLGIRQLFLFNNSIRTVDLGMARIFAPTPTDDDIDSFDINGNKLPPRLIDLSKNPLHCDCSLRWLRRHLLSLDPDEIKHVNVTCASPAPRLAGRSLQSLGPELVLECPTPRVKALSIEFGPVLTRLSCQATISVSSQVSSSRFSPHIGQEAEIAWIYQENGQIKETLKMHQWPIVLNQKGPSSESSSTLSVNVTIPPNQKRIFKCSTWLASYNNLPYDKSREFLAHPNKPRSSSQPLDSLDVNQNPTSNRHDVIVQIRTPPLLNQELMNVRKGLAPQQNSKNNPSSKDYNNPLNSITNRTPSSYLFRKQFTVLEMVGAVVGTFTITIFLLLLVARCMRIYRCRFLKTTASLKPYFTSTKPLCNYSNNSVLSPQHYHRQHLQQIDSTTYSHPINNNTAHINNTITNNNNINNNNLNNNNNIHNSNNNININNSSSNSNEYDVPRICETHTFPPPPIFDHIEFLDFKDPRKHFPNP